MLLSPLLPDPLALRYDGLVLGPDRLIIRLGVRATSASCPDCGHLSSRIHSHYRRTLDDLPTMGTPVQLDVDVSRFFCENRACPRRTFALWIPSVAAAHARKTARLTKTLCQIGLRCGGEGGSRLAGAMGMSTSGDAILDLIHRMPAAEAPTPHVLGVDDWAWHKGQSYGTLLCDLETHRPVDLLPDRSAQTFADWLKAHPGVGIISRDRAGCYAQGAQAGAPDAQQVADRFHLVHNLHDALKRMLDHHHADLREAARSLISSATTPASPPTPPEPSAPRPASVPALDEPPASRWLELYNQAWELHRQGISHRQIARKTGLDRATVRKYLSSQQFPQRGTRQYIKGIDHHVQFLAQRWAEGCHNARALTEELRQRGFKGSYYMVRRLVGRWRTGEDQAKPVPKVHRPSARAVAWLFMQDPSDRNEEDQSLLEALFQRRPELKAASDLALEFRHLLHDRKPEELDGWIQRTHEPGIPTALAGFADGLKQDYEAVKAAFSLEWSNGQVEGQINRLKLIKRLMFGRAGFELLRKRVLEAG